MQAYEAMKAGNFREGMSRLNAACRYDWTLRFSPSYFNFTRWALKLWLDDLLRRRRRRPASTL